MRSSGDGYRGHHAERTTQSDLDRQPRQSLLSPPISGPSDARGHAYFSHGSYPEEFDSYFSAGILEMMDQSVLEVLGEDSRYRNEPEPQAQQRRPSGNDAQPRCAGSAVDVYNQVVRNEASPGSTVITTLMIKNLPCKVTKQRLEAEICQLGFRGTYDFIHMPNRRNRSNLSYAFVNFVRAQDAARFTEAFEGHTFAGVNSQKRCHVCAADVQGLEMNRAHMSNGRYAW
eukprot:TRINITY_DN13347_c0_g4_i1.p1 TRINITY_DN13347_c0_g4~~TRINITY_DN13347_c0_g4_i1.p1  ORF type:complete len:229 (-),score=22.36 TRINITY_DN13347_c0_g4_i1:264-950(-)